jgi:hypothetical protein
MEYVSWAFWGFLAILGGVFLNMLASEAYDWCGRWAELIVRFAARRLPAKKRAHYEEEWLAHLSECPGKLGKITHACGTLWAASCLVQFAAEKRRNRRRSKLILTREKIVWVWLFALCIFVMIGHTIIGVGVAVFFGARMSDLIGISVFYYFTLPMAAITLAVYYWTRHVLLREPRQQ